MIDEMRLEEISKEYMEPLLQQLRCQDPCYLNALCNRPARTFENGRAYCGLHSPVARVKNSKKSKSRSQLLIENEALWKVVRAAQELWNCKEAGNGFCGKHLNDLEKALAPFAASEGTEEK